MMMMIIIIIIIISIIIIFLYLSLGLKRFFFLHCNQLNYFVSSVYNSFYMTNPLHPNSFYHCNTI